MWRHLLLAASFLTITGILFPVLSLISGADRTLLEGSAIVTWETYKIQPAINQRLANAILDPNDDPEIPTIVPDWYSLHYFTLCSGTFLRPTDNTTIPTRARNTSSTHCTPRWFDQATNMTQILLYAASKGLQDVSKFPPDVWDEAAIDQITNNLASIIVLEHHYDTSPVYPAVATLFTGFAFAVFSTPLILCAAFIAVTQRSMFRILPHVAMAFAALGAIFLTASAGLESNMNNLFAGTSSADSNISARSSSTFQGFQWSGAVGMWIVVFLVWFGGVCTQEKVVVNARYREKFLGVD